MIGKARVLDASGNQLKELPDWLRGAVDLKRLVLSRNQLTHLPPWIQELKHLKVLELSNNRLNSLPDLSAAIKVEQLLLASNFIADLSNSIGNMKSLRKLDLAGRHTFGYVETLSSVSHRLCSYDTTGFEDMRSQRSFLCASVDNKLTSLPAALGNCASLEELNARSNKLTSIPRELAALQQLQLLNLQGNQLRTFPSEILRECTSLHTLQLQDNPITPDGLTNTPGYAQFEERRRAKYNKVLSARVIDTKFDEPVSRNVE